MPITQTNTGIINPSTLNIKEQFVLSFLHTFLKSTGETLLKYQEISPWVIISLILMISGVEEALILQGEN